MPCCAYLNMFKICMAERVHILNLEIHPISKRMALNLSQTLLRWQKKEHQKKKKKNTSQNTVPKQ